MKDTDAAWLAGFLDGEGSFMIKRSTRKGYTSWCPEIAATSTTPHVLDHCKELVGGKIARGIDPGGNARRASIWMYSGKNLGPILEQIIPFLIIKKEQATILLALRREIRSGARKGDQGIKTCPIRNARREKMRLATRALNHRGKTEVPAEFVDALREVRAMLEIDESEFRALPDYAPVIPANPSRESFSLRQYTLF